MGRALGRGSAACIAVSVAASVLGACGSKEPGLLGDGSDFGGGGLGTGGGTADASVNAVSLDTTDDTLPGCGAGPDGGVCGCSDIAPLGAPPNLYYVLDRSGSMAEDGKWTAVRQVVSNVMTALGPRGLFGATVFPATNSTSQCAAGNEVFPLTAGDTPAGTLGPHGKALLAAMDVQPVGGTPTAATLASLIPQLTKLSGKTFVILATDGGPNCAGETVCDSSTCIPNIEGDNGCSPSTPTCCTQDLAGGENCLDADATTQSIQALHNAGIPTYVIGIPGSAPFATVLDAFAIAGGTSRGSEPQYYAVDTSDQTAIQAALSTIAAKIVGTCSITLSAAPPSPGLVNVYFDEGLVTPDPTNGWSINGATVTLLGTSCQKVLDGEVLDVRVIAGCPTVLR